MIGTLALLHRHRVDLGPEHDRWTLFPALEDCRQPGASEFGHETMRIMGLDELPYDPACLYFLAGKLGVSVEFVPQGHQLGHFVRAVHGAQVYACSTKKLILFLFSRFTNELYYAMRVYNG